MELRSFTWSLILENLEFSTEDRANDRKLQWSLYNAEKTLLNVFFVSASNTAQFNFLKHMGNLRKCTLMKIFNWTRIPLRNLKKLPTHNSDHYSSSHLSKKTISAFERLSNKKFWALFRSSEEQNRRTCKFRNSFRGNIPLRIKQLFELQFKVLIICFFEFQSFYLRN